MIHQVVSIFDNAVGAFNRPFFTPSRGVAIRSFVDEVKRPGDDNSMARHPNDFSLFYLGEFDDVSGRFSQLDVPERLMTAADAQA